MGAIGTQMSWHEETYKMSESTKLLKQE
jgi:hypothetical protein